MKKQLIESGITNRIITCFYCHDKYAHLTPYVKILGTSVCFGCMPEILQEITSKYQGMDPDKILKDHQDAKSAEAYRRHIALGMRTKVYDRIITRAVELNKKLPKTWIKTSFTNFKKVITASLKIHQSSAYWHNPPKVMVTFDDIGSIACAKLYTPLQVREARERDGYADATTASDFSEGCCDIESVKDYLVKSKGGRMLRFKFIEHAALYDPSDPKGVEKAAEFVLQYF